METNGMNAEMGNNNNYAIQSGYSPSLSVKHHAACLINRDNSMKRQGVDVYNHAVSGDVAVTLNANSGEPNTAGPKVLDVGDAELAAMRYIVRRLTPVECERLMGLPDRWTIPAFRQDEITDELVSEFVDIHNTFNRIMAEYANEKPPKPKTANQVRKWLEKIANPSTCPDAPRYKGDGNGMATNQPRWILLRLIHEDRKANNGND